MRDPAVAVPKALAKALTITPRLMAEAITPRLMAEAITGLT
jgi:hypothetical protein